MRGRDPFWEDARNDLRIRIELNAFVPGFNQIGRVDAIIGCFGAENGMIIVNNYEQIKTVKERLIDAGFGYSVVDRGGNYDRTVAIEMLRDWGWTCDVPPPEWY
jgi:hypothetical protein